MSLNKLHWMFPGPYIEWVTSKEKKEKCLHYDSERIKIYGLNNSNFINQKIS